MPIRQNHGQRSSVFDQRRRNTDLSAANTARFLLHFAKKGPRTAQPPM
jgi:hypothetical protein